MQSQTSARGNVLFLILVGIGLFAALGFAVTQMGRGSTDAFTTEQARLTASEIVQYGNGLRPIIDRMILLDGLSDINTSGNGILFSAPTAHADYGVVGAQPSTELFHASGGKASYLAPPPKACPSACAYEFSGQYTITGVGTDAKSELVMLLVGVDEHVCEKINATFAYGWSSVPTEAALTLTRFDGTNYGDAGGANPITLTGGSNEFVGKRAFCYQESSGAERFIYVHVIRAR